MNIFQNLIRMNNNHIRAKTIKNNIKREVFCVINELESLYKGKNDNAIEIIIIPTR